MLVTAASTAQHRLLVFRACEDGRCSSDAYLQWFRDYPPEVAHTAPVPELGEGRVVTSARWVRHRARPALVAVLDPREKGSEPQTVYLIPGQPGRYEIER